MWVLNASPYWLMSAYGDAIIRKRCLARQITDRISRWRSLRYKKRKNNNNTVCFLPCVKYVKSGCHSRLAIDIVTCSYYTVLSKWLTLHRVCKFVFIDNRQRQRYSKLLPQQSTLCNTRCSLYVCLLATSRNNYCHINIITIQNTRSWLVLHTSRDMYK